MDMVSQIGITMGDPSGVGPEIIVATLDQMTESERNSTVVVGNIDILRRANEVLGLNVHSFSSFVSNWSNLFLARSSCLLYFSLA